MDEKAVNKNIKVIKIDYDCLYDHNIYKLHSKGYMLLHSDGWFEGIICDVVNEEYYRYNSKNMTYSNKKLIYGIYHENKYLELLKIDTNAKVDPLAIRAININDLSFPLKEHWINEEKEENYNMIGSTMVIGFKEIHFGYNYLNLKKIDFSKDDIKDLEEEIKNLKNNDLYCEIYNRMLTYKDKIDKELNNIYVNKKMAAMYLPSSEQYKSNDEQAISRVVDDEYMISDNTVHKILKLRSLNCVKSDF